MDRGWQAAVIPEARGAIRCKKGQPEHSPGPDAASGPSSGHGLVTVGAQGSWERGARPHHEDPLLPRPRSGKTPQSKTTADRRRQGHSPWTGTADRGLGHLPGALAEPAEEPTRRPGSRRSREVQVLAPTWNLPGQAHACSCGRVLQACGAQEVRNWDVRKRGRPRAWSGAGQRSLPGHGDRCPYHRFSKGLSPR